MSTKKISSVAGISTTEVLLILVAVSAAATGSNDDNLIIIRPNNTFNLSCHPRR